MVMEKIDMEKFENRTDRRIKELNKRFQQFKRTKMQK